MIAREWGWRAALVAVAVPGLVLALLARLTLREPGRASAEGQSPPPFTEVLGHLWAKSAFRHMLAGVALTNLALYGSGAFLAPLFMRVYQMPIAQAAAMFGLASGISAIVGMSIAGICVDWVSRRDRRWYALLPAFGLAVACPLFLIAFLQSGAWTAFALIVAASICMFFFQTPSIAAMQGMAAPRMRATTAFLYFLIATVAGLGAGPPLVGWLSDLYTAHAFALGNFVQLCPGGRAPAGAVHALAGACASASATGLREALMTVSGAYLWAAGHYFLASRTVGRALDPSPPRAAQGAPAPDPIPGSAAVAPS
jgi:predicted MFS family arabinose efflux permease